MPIQQHHKAALEQCNVEDVSADQDGLLGDAQRIAMEMQLTSDELHRLTDIAEGLQDAVGSLEGLREADPHHLMLLEACLNVAQAGTVQAASDIVPSLESYLGRTISVEGIGESIKNFLMAIIRLMKKLWHYIADFFVSLFNEVGRLRLRLNYVHTLVSEIDGRQPLREQVALGNSAYGVCTEAGVPRDARAIVQSLNDLLHQNKVMREHMVPLLLSVGENFSRALPNWPNESAANVEWLKNLNHVATAFEPHAIAGAIGKAWPTHNPQWPAGSALAVSPLPGQRSLTFLSGAKLFPEKVSGNDMDRATMLQSSTILLSRQRQNSNLDLTKAVMETLSNDHVQQVTELVEKVLDEVETGIRAGLRSRLEKIGRQLENVGNKIDSSTDSDVLRLRKGIRYASVYTGWVQSSYVQLLAHDLLVCRAMLSLVTRHCAAYHK